MTSNQIRAKANKIAEHQNEIERAKLKETKRSNKAKESLSRANMYLSVPNAIGAGFGKGLATTVGSMLNHIEWYNKNKVSLENAASLPNSFLRGTAIDLKRVVGDPGIIIHKFVDTLPVVNGSNNLDSPINLAARSLFAINRSHNSGSVNYEAADYMMYIMGIASYIELYAFLIKLYSIATNSDKFSLYKQTATIESFGFDPTSILANVSGLRQLINTMADTLRTYAIPADIPYIARKIWLVSNTFKDKNSDRSQLHHFVPKYFFHYSDGLLSIVPIGTDTLTSFAELQGAVLPRLNELLFNESFAIMSGDTRKAFNNLYSIDNINVDVAFNPIYDEDINNQIRCGNLAPQPLTLDIKQVTDPDDPAYGTIYQGSGSDGLDFPDNTFVIEGYEGGRDIDLSIVLNLNKDNASSDDFVRATRFTCLFSHFDGKVKYRSCATEILVEDNIISIIDGSLVKYIVTVRDYGTANTIKVDDSIGEVETKFVTLVKLLSQFDNAPQFPILFYHHTETAPIYKLINISDNNFNQVRIGYEALDRINTVAFMSLIGVFSY